MLKKILGKIEILQKIYQILKINFHEQQQQQQCCSMSTASTAHTHTHLDITPTTIFSASCLHSEHDRLRDISRCSGHKKNTPQNFKIKNDFATNLNFSKLLKKYRNVTENR